MAYSDLIKKIQGNLTNRYCADFIGITERNWYKLKRGDHRLMREDAVEKLKELAVIRGVDPEEITQNYLR